MKTHTRYSALTVCNRLANLLMEQFRRLSMTLFDVTCTLSFTFLLFWHAFCHVTNKRIWWWWWADMQCSRHSPTCTFVTCQLSNAPHH